MANEFGRLSGSILIGYPYTLTAASYQCDSAYTFESAGKIVFCRFVSPVSQTAGALTVYAYPSAVTGSPTFKAEIRDANDDTNANRPDTGAAALAVTADVSPTAGAWSTFTFSGVTLVEGKTYFISVYNTHATPASNYTNWTYKPSLMHGSFGTPYMFTGGYSADGYATNPSMAGNTAPFVLKFDSGRILGDPYVSSTAHTSNANHRGQRFNLPISVKINGIFIYHAATTAITEYRIYSGASLIQTATAYFATSVGAGFLSFADITLAASTDYDLVAVPGSSTTAVTYYTTGSAEGSTPADVLSCRYGATGGYVDGATPGSYTLDTSRIAPFALYVSELPVSAGSGGGLPVLGGSVVR
jgi:hypothetical protein